MVIVNGLFWSSVGLILYTYCIYPALLVLLAKRKKHGGRPETAPPDAAMPMVSVLVAAYNEEKIISRKVTNLVGIDYPIDKIEFLIGSDGSTDGTNGILMNRSERGLRPILFPSRRGKASVLNDLVAEARGEMLIFSDANTFYQSDAVKILLERFSDPMVGAVCGELVLQADELTANKAGEISYWRYENSIKRLESETRTTIAATGAIYAIRRSLFKPLPTEKVVMDDFVIGLNIVKHGMNVKYEPRARGFERTTDSVSGEFRRKSRIGAANLHSLSEFFSLLHPRYGFVAFALWSHKIIRWCVPFLLIVIFCTSVVLAMQDVYFGRILFAELGLVALALVGFLCEKIKLRIGILEIPYYFLAMNAALFVGFIRFLSDRQSAKWDVVR